MPTLWPVSSRRVERGAIEANVGVTGISRDADNSANIRASFLDGLLWLDVMI